MSRFATIYRDRIEYDFWLALGEDGSVKLTAGHPSLARHQRAINVKIKLPMTVFRTPTLSASIDISDTPSSTVIDVEAAREALSSALGVDIDLRISQPGEGA